MSHQHLEVYLDSYNSEPIIRERSASISIRIGDKITREDWIEILSADHPEIELSVKVEDIRHLFWDADKLVHSLSIKVVPVES
ncbi:MAG: hypothetical protein O2780_12750 [Proteobacteria bacterium]|nr:hypothetical protein [Pseudomonadota bacterium]MDA1300137.1 hypothetical protein [Pseudomonadota bacterium]